MPLLRDGLNRPYCEKRLLKMKIVPIKFSDALRWDDLVNLLISDLPQYSFVLQLLNSLPESFFLWTEALQLAFRVGVSLLSFPIDWLPVFFLIAIQDPWLIFALMNI